MDYFQWDSSVETGIIEIDQQHKRLVEIINEFHAAMVKAKGREVMGDVIRRLVNYTKYHFASEEKTMLEVGKFTGYMEHRGLHDKLTKQVEEFQERHATGQKVQTMEFLEFLKDWLFKHIKIEDMKYVSCVKGGVENKF